MQVTRTFDLLDRLISDFNRKDILNAKTEGKWIGYSTEEYYKLSREFAVGLMVLGYKKGDKVATISNNRPEWNIMDMGMAMIGVIHVPVFTSLSSNEFQYVLSHSDAKAVFVSDEGLKQKIYPVFESLDSIKSFYSIDQIDHTANWKEIVELGSQNHDKYVDELDAIMLTIQPDDCATLIYTSGTTGLSKGVMLSHKNLVHNFIEGSKVFDLGPEDRYLSILPLCHVGGRMGNYQTQYSGASIYYAESMATIAANMKEVNADGFDTVPRILEKIYDNVIAKGNKLSGTKKKIFFWAVDLGLKYKLPDESSWWYKRKLKIADKLIFSKWREALGGKMRLAGCGGASLQSRLERIFWAAGIRIINMYGLTETSPIVTMNRQEAPGVMLGSVGALIEGVELKIADDGEILCRGDNVMLGYYKDEKQTSEVIDEDGWFHTGDIGKLEKVEYLWVTDRKKEIFKLSSGKYVAPQVIEGKFKESDYIEQLMVVGDAQKFAGAIVTPNLGLLRSWAKENNHQFNNDQSLIEKSEIVQLFNKEIESLNASLGQAEKIVRYKLVKDEWGPETGELSPTLKLRRNFIAEKYQVQIDELYRKN